MLSSPDRAVLVQVLAGCSLARHFTLTIPLSILVPKWVPMLGVTLGWSTVPSIGRRVRGGSRSLHATKTGNSQGVRYIVHEDLTPC